MDDNVYKNVIALCGNVRLDNNNDLYFHSDYAIVYKNNKFVLEKTSELYSDFEYIYLVWKNVNKGKKGDYTKIYQEKAKELLEDKYGKDNNYGVIMIRNYLIPYGENFVKSDYSGNSGHKDIKYSILEDDFDSSNCYPNKFFPKIENQENSNAQSSFIDKVLHVLNNSIEPIKNEIEKLEHDYNNICVDNDRHHKELEELDNIIHSHTNLNKDLQRLKELADNSYIARIFAEKQEEAKADCDKDKENGKYANAKLPDNIEKREGETLAEEIVADINKCRKSCDTDFIKNVLICIAQNFITVFAGQPGTGKTSLCDIIAGALGLDKLRYDALDISRYISVSVERGWNSKSELIGYYNALSKEYEDSGNGLYHALKLLDKEKADAAFPFFVLLDEANLSPVEHYWSAFMKLADDSQLYDEDIRGEITIGGGEKLKVPDQLRFLATVNNDLTTEPLSPRLLDRTSVIKLPEVDFNGSVSESQIAGKAVSWSDFKAAFLPENGKKLSELSLKVGDEDITLEEFLKGVYSIFKEAKMPVSIRIQNRIAQYIASAVALSMHENIAVDYAVAQNLLPKINGYYEDYADFISKLSGFVEYKAYAAKENKTSEDKEYPLLYDTLEAFEKAKENNEYISYLSL